MNTLDFEIENAVGNVIRVDTSSFWAETKDTANLTTVSIGSLVAVQGSTSGEFLVGTLEKVTRDSVPDDNPQDAEEDFLYPPEYRVRDLFKVVLLGTYRKKEGLKENTFKRGARSYPAVDAACWVIDGENLQLLMGVLTQQIDDDTKLTLGTFTADPTAKAVADGDKLFQRHAALLGSTGSGKSWAVALILERAKTLSYPNLVVLDMHGEYGPLTKGDAPIAKSFKIAGPHSAPASDSEIFLPWWLLNQSELQALLLDRSEQNAPNQAARLSHHTYQLKKEFINSLSESNVNNLFTVDSPIPFSKTELLERLKNDDIEMVSGSSGRGVKGQFNGKLTRFISRLENRLDDKRYSFMFGPNDDDLDYSWLHAFAQDILGTKDGIKVVDFSEVPSDILPTVVGIFTRIIYEIHFWLEPSMRTPVTFICDEAHLYLPSDSPNVNEQRALDSFERIAKEGRKYGVSLLVVSQRPADVSRTVLSQCNNFIVLRLANEQDQSVVKRLLPDNMNGVTSALPLLDVGEALLIGDSLILPTRIKLDKPTIEPNSGTMNFWSDWDSKSVSKEDLTKAVESLRAQARK